jgi:hypothetical protein
MATKPAHATFPGLMGNGMKDLAVSESWPASYLSEAAFGEREPAGEADSREKRAKL